MTELLRSAPDTDAPLAQDCLRLLAALLRACSTYRSAIQPVFAKCLHSGACNSSSSAETTLRHTVSACSEHSICSSLGMDLLDSNK